MHCRRAHCRLAPARFCVRGMPAVPQSHPSAQRRFRLEPIAARKRTEELSSPYNVLRPREGLRDARDGGSARQQWACARRLRRAWRDNSIACLDRVLVSPACRSLRTQTGRDRSTLRVHYHIRRFRCKVRGRLIEVNGATHRHKHANTYASTRGLFRRTEANTALQIGGAGPNTDEVKRCGLLVH